MNDVMKLLENKFRFPFLDFCQEFKIKKEGMIGGKFNRPNAKWVLNSLDELELLLGPDGNTVMKYLKLFKNLYEMYVAQDISKNYKIIIEAWKKEFDKTAKFVQQINTIFCTNI